MFSRLLFVLPRNHKYLKVWWPEKTNKQQIQKRPAAGLLVFSKDLGFRALGWFLPSLQGSRCSFALNCNPNTFSSRKRHPNIHVFMEKDPYRPEELSTRVQMCLFCSGPNVLLSLESKCARLFHGCQQLLVQHGEWRVRGQIQTIETSVSPREGRESGERNPSHFKKGTWI